MSITRSLLFVLLSAVLITACNSSTNTSDDAETATKENLVEKTGNPCLESWAIDRMKEHIKERAEELINTKYGTEAIDTSLIYGSEISFDYISQPTTLENGDVSCSAKVTISYLGDDNSSDELAVNYAKLVNTNIEYDSNPFANAYSGYGIRQELTSIGISEFNINEFSDIVGNTFATQMEYELRKTYSENGEEQQSYQAGIGKPAAMLATIALLDKFIQKNKSSNSISGIDNTEGAATKADSYYDDEYMEDYEVDSVVDIPQKQESSDRKEPESEGQTANSRDTAQPAPTKDQVEVEPDISEEDSNEEKYDTAYVYDGDNIEQ